MALQVGSALSMLVAPSSKAAELAGTAGASTTLVTKAPVAHVDTVQRSLSARIHQLKSQGQSAHQIATSLGVDSKTVALFFSAAPAAFVAKPAPAVADTDGDGTRAKVAVPQTAPAAAVKTPQVAAPAK